MVLGIITFLTVVSSPIGIWSRTDTATDSGVFKLISMMMHKGYMPYRDVFDHKGPLIYLINYLGDFMGYRGVWILEFITVYVTYLFIYKIARLQCRPVASCVIVFICATLSIHYYEGGNLVEEYAMPFIASSLYIFLDYLLNEKITKIRLLICGFGFAAIGMLRINMAVVWVVFCIVVLIQCVRKKAFQKLREFLLYFMIGFLILTLPILLWLGLNGALKAFFTDYIQFNMTYISDTNTVSIHALRWNTFFEFLADGILMIVIAVSAYRCMIKRTMMEVAYFIFIVLSLVTVSLSGVVRLHYGMILIPTLVYPLAGLVREELGQLQEKRTQAIVLILATLVVVPRWIDYVGQFAYQYTDGNQYAFSYDTDQVCRVIQDNTDENDRISVYGNWDLIYVLSNRLPATKYSYQYPIGTMDEQIFTEYFNQLTIEKPEIIVIQKGYYDQLMPEFLQKMGYRLLWKTDKEFTYDEYHRMKEITGSKIDDQKITYVYELNGNE